MEKPYKGRAIIKRLSNEFYIEVPAKKNWFVILFIGFWSCGWLFGELTVLGILSSGLFSGEIGFHHLFLIGWLGAWTVGGFVAIRTVVYMVFGKEILLFKHGLLTIDRKAFFFFKKRTYDLHEVKNFSTNKEEDFFSWPNNRRKNMNAFGENGVLQFNYGMKTIKIGGGIDRAEGRYLIKSLTKRGFLKPENLY